MWRGRGAGPVGGPAGWARIGSVASRHGNIANKIQNLSKNDLPTKKNYGKWPEKSTTSYDMLDFRNYIISLTRIYRLIKL